MKAKNGEFNLDFGVLVKKWILVKTVVYGGLQAKNKMKKTKKNNSLKHWATGLRS